MARSPRSPRCSGRATASIREPLDGTRRGTRRPRLGGVSGVLGKMPAVRTLLMSALGIVLVACSGAARQPEGANAGSGKAAVREGFAFSARKLPPRIRKLVTGVSWHRGCPVPRGELRYLHIAFYDFDGRVRRGEMVANASAVPALRSAFGELYAKRFPIRRMRLVDHYGGSDFRSIEADNTSAFNCRHATGQSRWSEHAYGRAVDLNPIENPYVLNGRTSHRDSRPYLDRSRHRRGMAYAGGTLVRAFKRVGWGWGGDWSNPTDYQHFSSSGR